MVTLTDPQTQPAPLQQGVDMPLRMIPLGGVGTFGLNMMCYEVGDERIVVDCGSMFPDMDMFGVDLVIPDVQYLLEKPEALKAFIITHAHEDHYGALPYVLTQIKAPIYATPMTLAFLEEKLAEHGLLEQVELRKLEFRDWENLGKNFQIQALHATHSVPDTASIAIRTPPGVIIHTGDYKIDYSPIDGRMFDTYGFSSLGEEGVLALVGDSTNANVSGSTKNERWVAQHLEPIIADAEGTVFCAIFSSSIHRMQVVMDLALKLNKKIFVMGRSLEKSFRIASAMGYLRVPRKQVMQTCDFDLVEPSQRIVLVTGSQGEPASVMARLARGEHGKAEIVEGDTVIISARAIPNNIRAINNMINHLCRRGARVLDSTSAKVHASGHACQEEMKAMLNLTNPRYLVPVHGELRQQLAHRDLALSMGFVEEDIFVLADGDILEFRRSQDDLLCADLVGRIEIGYVLVDGKTVGETSDVVLRDRRHLSEDGMLIAILNVDKCSGELLGEPEIVTRGFVYVDESEELIERLSRLVREAFEACSPESREEPEMINPEIRRALRKYIRKNFERFPLILPVIQRI